MKKIITFVLSMTAALSLSLTAFAAAESDPANTFGPDDKAGKETTVNFSVAPTYTVTIPAKVTLAKDASDGNYRQDAVIKAENVRLLENKKVKVTLAGDFRLTTGENGTSYELPYTVKVGDSNTAIQTGDIVATFGTSTTDQTSTLHFAADNPTYAGEYTDTVTFTISVE